MRQGASHCSLLLKTAGAGTAGAQPGLLEAPWGMDGVTASPGTPGIASGLGNAWG